MYRAYFKLKENPFSTTVSSDTKYFYLTPSHAESMAKCEYAIRNKSELALVYGDYGTGKTSIMFLLKERFEREGNYTIAVFDKPNQTSDAALLTAISKEFGLKPPRSKQATQDQLEEFLAAEVAAGRTPLLLFDEAHELRNSRRADRDMLGMIKTLTNLRVTDPKGKSHRLIHIVMFGQLPLIELLESRPELLDRVSSFGFLSQLTLEDAKAMLSHRWKVAGGKLPFPMADDALEMIYRSTKGLPRGMINVTNSAFIYAYGARMDQVNRDAAEYALFEFFKKRKEQDV
jgi:type II secretory pathway predicted ATPase ExeA